jgi:hypothetical protein
MNAKMNALKELFSSYKVVENMESSRDQTSTSESIINIRSPIAVLIWFEIIAACLM